MFKEFYFLGKYTELKSSKFIFDKEIEADGFRVSIAEDGSVVGRYSDERGKEYMFRAMKTLTRRGKYPICQCCDWPSFSMRGVVEGFYGKPYSWTQRLSLMKYLSELKMNTYIYAPKGDEFHRDKWRISYPSSEMENLKKLAVEAERNNIAFYYALSPGKDFDFAEKVDFQAALSKLEEIRQLGIEHFALLMDDIDPTLSPAAEKKFKTPAGAHAALANYIYEHLRPQSPLLFCPTDYMQNFDTPYRTVLRGALNEEISVFWTGYNTVAEAVTDGDGEAAAASFGRKCVLWDNYPVNDFQPKRRIYLGAIQNRGRYLPRTHTGYIANLSELYECSKIPLSTMAEYAWDSENYEAKKALDKVVGTYFKGCVKAGKIFTALNGNNVMCREEKVRFAVEKEDFLFLDKHYRKVNESIKILRKKAPVAFLEEAKALLNYAENECELYFSFRRGEDISRFEKVLGESKYSTADFSLLRYFNEKKGTHFRIDEERKIYRKIGEDKW